MALHINNLETLCLQLKCTLINEKIKLIDVLSILDNYEGSDWKEFIKFNDHTYNRIPIYTSPQFDIFIICWRKGQKSQIHDHPQRGCLMKLLAGELFENIYTTADLSVSISSLKMEAGQIGYIENNQILHEIYSIKDSVSLHIYSPGGYITKYYN